MLLFSVEPKAKRVTCDRGETRTGNRERKPKQEKEGAGLRNTHLSLSAMTLTGLEWLVLLPVPS